ncbi:hypothetical protein RMSM_07380 [Rhodopirellula maiorica SM1]|uniref:Apea-like HEPN domain-containing protein n=1 Tax=Rhodopirellula maiorica SM1 TaxID=1265738 RepID=M5R8I3_9BACT|nr:hypothetical protein RMSM_07380 [Rhodopirellula maiorica SM1]
MPGCHTEFQTFQRNADDPIVLQLDGAGEAEFNLVRDRARNAYDSALGITSSKPGLDVEPINSSAAIGAPDPQDISGDWMVIVPVFQLKISDDQPINGCWTVGDVDFLSLRELGARFPNRPAPVVWDRIVANDSAFAVVTKHGTPRDLRKTVFREFRKAAEILASTAAFHGRRHHACGFTLKGYPSYSARNDRFVQLDGTAYCGNWNQHGYLHPFELDNAWHEAISQCGIIELFARLTDRSLDNDWRRQIGSASAMLGRSIMSLDRVDAFLLDVIGLETLLTRPRERNGGKLFQRIKGLSGWHLAGQWPNYEADIRAIHETRCAIVHDSDYDDLTIEMLLLADMYLANGLLNVVTNPTMFPTKDDLVQVSDGYAANENWPTDGSLSFRWFGNPNFSQKDLDLPLW